MISRRWLRTLFIVGLAGICLVSAARALDPNEAMSQYLHDKWGDDRGFVGGTVYAISQSADGYLWIGTERGLVRFDGFNFTLIQRPIPTLPRTGPVRGLVSDVEGNLWIRFEGPHMFVYRNGTFEDVFTHFGLPEDTFTAMSRDNAGGVLFTELGSHTLRYRNGKFETIANATEVPGTVISITETRDGKLWMGTRDDGLYRMDNGHFSYVSGAFANAKINSLLPANNGDLWIGTDAGILFLNRVERAGPDLPKPIGQLQILAMTKDRDANVWVGSDHGLMRVASTGAVSFDQLSRNPGNAVTAIYEDRDGNLWYGGSRGIERLRDGMFTTYSTNEGLPSESNGPIYVDSEGRTWFAPMSGGLYWLKNRHVERVAVAGLQNDVVYSISGGDGEVWIGRQRGGLTVLTKKGDSFAARSFTQANGLAQNSVYSVHRARDGTVWAGTVSAGVSRLKDGSFTNYSTADGLASSAVNSIVEGYDGSMWFATPNGLARFRDGHWTNRAALDGLPSSDVRSIFEDSKHALWIATSGGLALLASGHLEVPRNLPEALHEQIFGIAEDGLGALWFATSDHVVQVDRDRLRKGSVNDSDVQNYGIEDGLHGVEGVARDRSMVSDALGRLWISLNRGLAFADRRSTLNNPTAVTVRIESISAGDAEVSLQNSPKIGAGSQSVTFHYAGTCLFAPERVRYRYKLDGSDQGWSDVVALRQVVYKNLGPGSYRFRVVASSSAGLWNGPETTVPFVIEKAFWQTWWFQVSCLTAFALVILVSYRLWKYRLTRRLNSRFQERLAERTRIAQELHDTLLQSFQGLMLRFQTVDEMLPARPSDAKHVLEGALNRADQALTDSRNAIQDIRSSTPAALDLPQALNALMTELSDGVRAAKGEAPNFDVLIEGAPRKLRPTTLEEIYPIARESLRNAFQHALATRIEAEITFGEHALRLRFRDDGKGIDPKVLDRGERAGHWGLVGMKERAKRMGAQFDIWSKPGAGTELELSLPGSIAYEPSPRRPGFKLFRKKAADNHDHRS